MKKSKRTMRRIILGKLYELMQEDYSIAVPRDTFLEGEFTHHELDAMLAFKSDAQVMELRIALDRLEEGTLDVCIGCKGRIAQEVLDADPTSRICERCEQELNRVVARGVEIPLHA